MKTLAIVAAFVCSLFIAVSAAAQSKTTTTVKVWGNCGMCKKNIEKAAKSAGASTASWDENSKDLKFTYAVNKTSPAKVQEAVAKAGYDTQDNTADDKAYGKLHACCKYERKAAEKSNP